MGFVSSPRIRAAELAEVRSWLRTGEYRKAIELAEKPAREGKLGEEWPLLYGRGLLTVGRYPEAFATLTNAIAHNSRSLRLRWLGREASLANGDTRRAAELLDEIRQSVSGQRGASPEPSNLVALARAALLFGADPKVVLDKLLEPARKTDPEFVETYLARGEIALEKHDSQLAARAFDEGLTHHPDDPDLHFGLARAHLEGDRTIMVAALGKALELNPHHLPSLLLLANHHIDAEEYPSAAKTLDEVQAVNPWSPDAWAYRAVLAHLRNDSPGELTARTNALRYWASNPRVDHLIGTLLSQKYRFAEGAEHQRQALKFDPDYFPAKAQLATDLLRLGEEEEGWRLAQEVQEHDAYDVSAYNLVTLRDTMGKYTTLTNAHFILRLSSHEAEVYGPRALDLLERARIRLSAKYGLEPRVPTVVEIFAEQKDFGVRTFGMPDNPGYLGVCFGRVVTANGPGATHGHDANWEAVLWHEFTHVITLQLTINRMPRWLSEGISVYEELQADPSWGQHMNPKYRGMILEGELTPIGRLSGAFLAPKTPLHLQFAYFESLLVVDYVIQRFGFDALKAILLDLRTGTEINGAIAAHTEPLPALEKSFAKFATEQANGLASGLDWEKPAATNHSINPFAHAEKIAAGWASAHPTNYWALRQLGQRALAEKDWAAAQVPLKRLLELFPSQTGPDSAYPLLATTHRFLGETNEERQVLGELARRDHEASEAYLRLMELESAAKNWPEVKRNAQRFLAVNPLVAPPYRYLAEASEADGEPAAAVAAYQTLLHLDPPNPAETHFQLARLLQSTQTSAARRHLLQALEESPRHRPSLRLLLQLQTNAPATNSNLVK